MEGKALRDMNLKGNVSWHLVKLFMDPERRPLSIEDLARTRGFPISFIRLAIDCGCPTENGKIAFSSFVFWLADNYALVRARAGLQELPSEEGLTKRAAAHVKIGNMLLTISDYLESRSTAKEIKAEADEISQFILRVMDAKTDDD